MVMINRENSVHVCGKYAGESRHRGRIQNRPIEEFGEQVVCPDRRGAQQLA